ncbi:MAG: isochorismate synthase, partial [Actinobacteria bacterium]|nr:isochorismate synthase [Actinomycetota bacterium]
MTDRSLHAPVTADGLHAVTRTLDTVDDLLDALGPDGFIWSEGGAGLATSGVAARVPAARVAEVLATVVVDDEVQRPGTGAVAVGALPFDRDAEAVLTVPARVVGRDGDGRCWVTHIGPRLEPAPAPLPRATRFTVRSVEQRGWWEHAVEVALDDIAHGRFEKVVLAREVLVEADTPFEPRAVLRRLRSQQPGCILYADAGFVGATPELLVRRTADSFECRPMAGTAPGSVAAEVAARLSASGKDAREHRFVVEAMRDALGPVVATIAVPDTPVVEHFGSLAHLVTPILGTLAADDPAELAERGASAGAAVPSALDLARRLHPTPAVGGTPTDAALDAIRR